MYINRYIFHAVVMLLFLYSGSLKAADLTAPLGNAGAVDVLNDGNSLNDPIIKIDIGPDVLGGGGGGLGKGVPHKVSPPSVGSSNSTGKAVSTAAVGVVGGVVSAISRDPSVIAGAVTGGSNSSVGAQNGGAVSGSVGAVSGSVGAVSGSVGAAGSVIGGAGAGALTGQYDLAALKAALYAWRDRWQKVFEGFTKQGIALKEALARKLEWCANTYVAGSVSHSNCSKAARDDYEKSRAELEERINRAKALSDEELAKLEEDIEKALSVAFPNVNVPSPTAPAANPANDVPTAGGVCKIGGVWQVCEGVKQGDTVCNVNGVWRSCGSTDVVGSNLGGTVGVNSGANVGVNTSTTVVNNSTTTNTNTSTNTSTNAQVQDIPKFEDKNDVADFCAKNPDSLLCLKFKKDDNSSETPNVGGWVDAIMGALGENQKKMPEFSLEKFLNSGSRAQCPAPMSMSVYKFQAQFSLKPLCDFLSMVRPIVVICFIVSTAFFVVRGIKA